MTPRDDLIERLQHLAEDMSRASSALGEMAATPGVKDAGALHNLAWHAGSTVGRIYDWVRVVKLGSSS